MKLNIFPFHPCLEGLEYYHSKPSFESAWNECERGDFMLWMASSLRVDDRLMARAKALCANTVRHLMTDSRSTDAIDAALRYADGEITRDELTDAANAARVAFNLCKVPIYENDTLYAAAAAAASNAAAAASAAASAANTSIGTIFAAYAAANAAAAAADAAFSVAAAAAAAAEESARSANRLQTANICREILTGAIMEKVKRLSKNHIK